ncbi:peptidoglycan-binding protein [Streptomyces sp. CoH17]|uniref:peptidoglycan-binding protein n=1 Tax=Streptomyces sp. CoH17 TaxID=2992806 RepID=UPI002271CFB4|nr:peptidoglycan-binding protein [Streptomyces sp. CoH17]
MTKTGPQKFPGASTAYWYQNRWGGDSMESNVIVVHTTETIVLPGYSGGGDAPNMTALPKISSKIFKWYQHFDFDTSSRALVNLKGGVETNTLNSFQIELVGTCDPTHKSTWKSEGKTYKAGVDYIYWPDAPDWALKSLAELFAWAHEKHGVKLQSTVKWKAYPSSYGTRAQNGVRLTNDQWLNYYGILGHQHVPENLHGDPGDLNISKVIEYAKDMVGGTEKPPTKPQPKPKYEPFPGAGWFTMGRKSPIVKAMRLRLIAEGCSRYQSSSDQDVIGSGDKNSYEAWQRKCGFAGKAATWPPGKTTWDKLKVPNV